MNSAVFQRRKSQLGTGANEEYVYIRDKTHCWLPCKKVSVKKSSFRSAVVIVSLPDDWAGSTCNYGGIKDREERTVDLRDYPCSELPLQNVDENGILAGHADIADTKHLHEAAVLYNLKDRHYKGFPYTRVGDIMIAFNPFQWMDNLYTDENQLFYAKHLIWEEKENTDERWSENGYGTSCNALPPHIYETASLAYKGLAIDRQNQTILVTGESGAGKTETVKLVMSYLTGVQSNCPRYTKYSKNKTGHKNAMDKTVEKILESNPIFEAFGNSRTVRNRNSSRFGKFTQLQFAVQNKEHESSKQVCTVPECVLIGSKFDTYLLEKSRVVSHDDDERTYHIFYQLMCATEEEKKYFWDEGLSNTLPSSFRYFFQSNIESIDGISDEDDWKETVKALHIFGISGDKYRQMIRALCVVLQLGNLTFAPDPYNPDTGTIVSSPDELAKLSNLLSIKEDVLAKAFTNRKKITAWDEINFSLSPFAAKDECDALAKEIYSCIFNYLVRFMNRATNFDSSNPTDNNENVDGVISLLDIFGFEYFKVNRFEQLLINYCNERLQQKYVTDIFRDVQSHYEEENIEIFDFSSVDNIEILKMIEGKMGLLMILNEESFLPQGNDESFVYKMKAVHKDSKILKKNQLDARFEFTIAHFASTVKYDARKIIEKNTDALPTSLVDISCTCSNELIASEFLKNLKSMTKQKTERKNSSGRNKKESSVASKFKSQLNSLMKGIETTRTRYIRCIKPNADKLPKVTDHEIVMHQLKTAGIVAAITISKETFPNYLSYNEVIKRFQCLASADVRFSINEREKVNSILSENFQGEERVVGGHSVKPYAIGKTKVFFRSGSLEILESKRQKLYASQTVKIQTLFRASFAKNNYFIKKNCVVKIQKVWRGKLQRKKYLKLFRAAITIQTFARVAASKKCYQSKLCENAAILIQKRWIVRKHKVSFQTLKKAAIVVQFAFRNRKSKDSFDSSLANLVLMARKENELKKLQSSFSKINIMEATSSMKDDLLGESETMIIYLRSQLKQLRDEAINAKAELRNEKQKFKVLKIHCDNIEASLEANKLELISYQKEQKNLTMKCEQQKEENTTLRNSIKKMEQTHSDQIRKETDEVRMKEMTLEIEFKKNRTDLTALQKKYNTDMRAMHMNLRKAKDNYRAEVSNLEEEIQRMLQEHSDDLSQMFEALEATKKSEEMIKSVDDFTKAAYEDKIEELNKEIKFMKEMHAGEVKFLKEKMIRGNNAKQ